MRILITGGAGFIGSHIVNDLAKRGHFVVAIDDLSGTIDWSNVNRTVENQNLVITKHGDCASLPIMQKVIEKHGPFDVIVHAAANAREGASQFQPTSICEKNLLAHSAVMSAGINAGVKNFVIFSSMSVYGKSNPPFDESTPVAPEDVYAVNKVAMEQNTHILCDVHGARYTIVRPHNVFGENQALHDKHRNVVAIFMNRIMRGEPLFIYGDGEQERAFSYIEDSLPCFTRVIEGLPTEDVYNRLIVNIGGKQEISVNTMAAVVKEAMGVAPDYPVEYYKSRPREVHRAFSTYAVSEQVLQYQELIGWRDGVFKMAAWAKKQGPHDWFNSEVMEIINENLPQPWRE